MSDQSTVTERDYIAALRERITLDDWGAIIDKAIEDAKAGDRAARDWIARQVIGDNRISLAEIAAYDRLGVTSEHLIAAQADELDYRPGLMNFAVTHPTLIQRAIDLVEQEQQKQTPPDAQNVRRAKQPIERPFKRT